MSEQDRSKPLGATRGGASDALLERARGEVRDGRPLAELIEELTADEREGLGRIGFVLLRPDALAAGSGAAILAHLAGELGLRPVALRVLAGMPPALVDATYHRQPKIPRHQVWLQHGALGSGPVAALIVAASEPIEPDLSAWLYTRKGATSTLRAAEGESLRERFGRTSSLHAVVHMPEDVPALGAEASLFFPWETIRAAAQAPAVDAAVAAELVTLEPLPGRVVFQAALKVKRRIAAALWLRAPGAAWLERLRALSAEADDDLDGAPYIEQHERMLAFAAAEREPLEEGTHELEERNASARVPGGAARAVRERALRAARAPLELVYASWFLGGHEAYGGDGGERLFASLAEHDVPLSAAQRSLLAAGLRHDLHPGARSHGERVWPLGPDPGGDCG